MYWLPVIILAVLLLVYLWAIMPRLVTRPDCSALNQKYYAHRGFYDNKSEAPENSMAAFRRAVEAGYGIEMDVQLTKDRIPVVFHDETLKRACGVDSKVRDFTYRELQQFRLFESEERIPLFSDFLKLIDGRVPLIIEIKSYEKNPAAVCPVADKLICQYKGPYCVESFHPIAVKWYRDNRPDVIRGQLSSDFSKPDKKERSDEKLVHYLLTNFLCRPDFIAYDHHHKNNISRMICTYLFRPLSVTWTVKSQKELDNCRKDFELFIFEGFTPED